MSDATIARGVVVERPDRPVHPFGVEITEGPEEGLVFAVVGNAKAGWVVEVSYWPDDQFATIKRVIGDE